MAEEEVLGGVTTGANLEIGLTGMSGNNFRICIVCGCGGGLILLDEFMAHNSVLVGNWLLIPC